MSERIRELVSLIGSLSKEGDTISLDAISSRLGITTEDAQQMMNIICQASGENSGGLLISCDESETEYTLQYPGIHGKPVRLTPTESMALFHALDTAGLESDDPLRKRVEVAFAQSEVDEKAIRRALGPASEDSSLIVCARAQATNKLLVFQYQGSRDAQAKTRRAVVRSLRPHRQTWLIDALDIDIDQERCFRLDRMSSPTLGDTYVIPQVSTRSEQLVEVVFHDEKYLHLYEWPGLTVLRKESGIIHARIPYYESKPDWLLRRIIACNATVEVLDERIMADARAYASHLLRSRDSHDL